VDVELDPDYLTSLLLLGNENNQNEDDEECDNDNNNLSGGNGKEGGSSSKNGANNNIAVYRARIRRFAIHLSVCDVTDSQNKNNNNNEGNNNNTSKTSTARKATSAFLQGMFGSDTTNVNNNNNDGGGESTSSSTNGIALMAHVELEGLDIVLTPAENQQTFIPKTEWSTSTTTTTTTQRQSLRNQPLTPNSEDASSSTSSSPGFFSSLVDSALKSLRLSIDISDVNVRAYSTCCHYGSRFNNDDDDDDDGIVGGSVGVSSINTIGDQIIAEDDGGGCWVSLRIASARYYDLIGQSNSNDGETTTRGASSSSSSWVSSNNGRLSGGSSRNGSKNDTKKTREKVVVAKAFDWEGIVIDTGEMYNGEIIASSSSGIASSSTSTSSSSSLPIFQSSGGGKVRFRVYEKWSKKKTNTNTEHQNQKEATFISARQDIEISLGQRMSIDIDLRSATHLVDIANAIMLVVNKSSSSEDDDGDFVDACEENNDDDNTYKTWEGASSSSDFANHATVKQQQPALADEFSKETYDQIMKQYTEARHLARTRELRGGLLIPSFNDGGDDNVNDSIGGDISFDAFFDANDHSVSYYCSMVDDETMMSGSGEGQPSMTKGKKGHRSLEQTKIELGLSEFTVNMHIRSQNNLKNTTEEDDRPSEYVLISLGDLRVIVFKSIGETKVNCSVSHFDIESQVVDRHGTIVNEPLLRFLDGADNNGGVGGSELLVSSPPCISVMAEFSSEAEDESSSSQACRVDVVLQPLEIVHQEQALKCMLDVIAKVPRISAAAPSSDEGENSKPTNIHFSVSSSSIILMAPCQHYSKQIQREAKPNPLFQRHGYKDQGSGGSKFSGLGLELDNVTIDLSRKISCDTSLEESKAALKCSNVILFAKGTELERVRRRNRKFSSYISRRADLVAFTGDEDSESEASVMVSFSTITTQHGSRAFPIILPLSSTKARQEMDDSDDDENDDLYVDALKSTSGANHIQSSDPQYILSSEANEAERELAINIPVILFDSTTSERHTLANLLSTFRSSDNDSECSNSKPTPTDSAKLGNKNLLGLAINVGQLTVALHGSNLHDSNSYSLIMDKMQIHTLLGSSGVRNIRFLSHDVTLYELSNGCPAPNIYVRHQYPTTCTKRCKRIQERLTKSPSTIARAIFFRQKLCQSLSPETPAILLDALMRGDDECGEMTIHINVYDMTYRYIMNSEWIQNLSALLKNDLSEKESSAQVEERIPREEINVESSSSLTNLFVTLADCNFDYSPPQTFKRRSRVILRMGEIRLTSNIVTPAAAVQAYKVSLSDLRLHICNYRHSYNEENSLLSLAHRHLSKDDTVVPDKASCLSGRNIVGLDDALCRMDFVNVVVVDTLDAIIFKSNNVRGGHRQNDPASTVALTLGKLSVYACRDSFSCLNESYNEWFIKSTTLSEEEIEKLREASESQSEVGLDQDSSSAENECLLPLEHKTPPIFRTKNAVDDEPKKSVDNSRPSPISNKRSSAPSHQEHRDDAVSLDLTKSLLFQNYYTFDAKSNRQELGRRQEVGDFAVKRNGDDKILQSSSSEDEWATVEHDFARHSNIPRERDQSAGWVICDSNTTAGSTWGAQTSSQPKRVKVFPQHIPVRPNLDPFAGGTVNTAKLAGTHVAPDIGARVIVKDGAIILRFFEGLDWVTDAPQFHQRKERITDRKKVLLSGLIDGDEKSSPLNVPPLPEERNKNLQRELARKKLRRNPNRYFQISIGGLKLKNDSFAESKDHQLSSILDLSMSDFFIAETISNGDPSKMMGEWINESEHPRDDSDGIIMLKMTTKHPKLRVSSDGKLMSDESRATLELLPLRFYLNQNALRFIRSFFAVSPSETGENDSQDGDGENDGISDDEIINIFFESFKVRPCKLKVDYQPENMDIDSFRDGNYVEILNLCPLEDMVLALQPVEMEDLTGWGSVFGELAGRWVEDICATQAHKFFTRAAPFQPLSNLGDPLADLFMVLVVPEGGVTNYIKSIVGGTTNFAGKFLLEALSTSAKITRFAANQLNTKALPSGRKSSLLRRPRNVPRHAGDTAGHAYESVARGLREANYKIVTVPLREYQHNGAGGAARSALKGIPIGVIAPIAGASEALSYTLLGLRNQLRPDIRKEEEASLRGLQD